MTKSKTIRTRVSIRIGIGSYSEHQAAVDEVDLRGRGGVVRSELNGQRGLLQEGVSFLEGGDV